MVWWLSSPKYFARSQAHRLGRRDSVKLFGIPVIAGRATSILNCRYFHPGSMTRLMFGSLDNTPFDHPARGSDCVARYH